MHVVVNAAMSADGKLSSARREQIRISGPDDFTRVDQLRAESDAVVVGVGTVLADDPHLTLTDPEHRARRLEAGRSAHPARVVVDSRGRTPVDARVLDDVATTYLCCSDQLSPARREELIEANEAVEVVTAGMERVDLEAAFSTLTEGGLEDLMVEGGGELIFSLLEAGLVDDLSVFIGPQIIGGRDAPTLADGDGFVSDFPDLTLEGLERVDDGVLLNWRVRD